MTVKKKMIVIGGVSILIFSSFFAINIETYRKYQKNMKLRENASARLIRIEESDEWKKEFSNLMNQIVVSGHVPDNIPKKFLPPSDTLDKENKAILNAGKTIIELVRKKETKTLEIKAKEKNKRLKINELYHQLDMEIATVLAEAEIAQIMGENVSEKSSAAAYILKSLNQITLIALNTLISKELTEKDRGVMEKNKKFVTSQISTFTENQQASILFHDLFSQVDMIDTFNSVSKQELSDMERNISEIQKAFDKISKADTSAHMILEARAEVERANRELEKASQLNLMAMFLLLAGGLLAVSGVLWFIFFRVLGPIRRFTMRLNKTANQLALAAEQVADSSQSVAIGAASQAASAEEISSSLEEVSSMSRQNSDRAGQMDTFMSDLKNTIGAANTSVNQLSESIEDIARATDDTSGIIKSIQDVAFQTNLLSLNAAVEAARAGENGAGFAVVAEEVRSLATRTSELAKNTSELLAMIIRKVGDGSVMLADTNERFSEIVNGSLMTATLAREISSFSGEQTKGIEQVSEGVLEIDRVIQKNASSAEEYASISGDLSSQAEQMKTFMEELMRIIG